MATGHDVFVTAGLFSVCHMEFTLTSVAALLTLAGYSINDTVVVFDRIRENRRKYKRMGLADLINLSTNQMLVRTILTSAATATSIIPLLLFGGPTLFDFTAAILFGRLRRHVFIDLCRGSALALSSKPGRQPGGSGPGALESSERVQRLLARVAQITCVDAGAQSHARPHGCQRYSAGALIIYSNPGDEIIASLDPGEFLKKPVCPLQVEIRVKFLDAFAPTSNPTDGPCQ